MGTLDEPTADVLDRAGEAFESCELQLRDFGGSHRFSGRVRTVRCDDDNVLVRRLATSPGEGGVLVVDNGASLRTAMVGGQIARLAADNGWAAIVINGAVRDVHELEHVPIVVRALGSNPRASGKLGAGAVDVAVSFGGATFEPGALAFGDGDGLIVERRPTAGPATGSGQPG